MTPAGAANAAQTSIGNPLLSIGGLGGIRGAAPRASMGYRDFRPGPQHERRSAYTPRDDPAPADTTPSAEAWRWEREGRWLVCGYAPDWIEGEPPTVSHNLRPGTGKPTGRPKPPLKESLTALVLAVLAQEQVKNGVSERKAVQNVVNDLGLYRSPPPGGAKPGGDDETRWTVAREKCSAGFGPATQRTDRGFRQPYCSARRRGVYVSCPTLFTTRKDTAPMPAKVPPGSAPHPDRLALERELQIGAGAAVIPWTDRPVTNLPTAATLLGCSTAQVYALAAGKKLELVKIAGRTCVRTDGIAKLIREAEPWTPSGRTRAAVTERHRRAAARLAS